MDFESQLDGIKEKDWHTSWRIILKMGQKEKSEQKGAEGFS